jgi:hypothetical protein
VLSRRICESLRQELRYLEQGQDLNDHAVEEFITTLYWKYWDSVPDMVFSETLRFYRFMSPTMRQKAVKLADSILNSGGHEIFFFAGLFDNEEALWLNMINEKTGAMLTERLLAIIANEIQAIMSDGPSSDIYNVLDLSADYCGMIFPSTITALLEAYKVFDPEERVITLRLLAPLLQGKDLTMEGVRQKDRLTLKYQEYVAMHSPRPRYSARLEEIQPSIPPLQGHLSEVRAMLLSHRRGGRRDRGRAMHHIGHHRAVVGGIGCVA